jgi:Tol biopolymer transport system component
MRHSHVRVPLRAGISAVLIAGGLATGIPSAAAALPPDLLVSVETSANVFNLMSVPSGAGAPTKFFGNASDVAVSRDATQLVYRQQLPTSQAWVLADATGRVQRTLFTTEPGVCATPDWSPDGTKLLFSCSATWGFPGSQTYAAVTVVTVATGASKRILPQGRYNDILARWSPKGDLIAFTRVGGPTYNTYSLNRSRVMLLRPDGTGLTPLAASATLSEHGSAFSPDGTSVAFVTRAYESQTLPVVQEDLAIARVSDGATTRISRASTTGAARYFSALAFSPDGSTVAALETADWQSFPIMSRVALVPAGGGATTYAASGASQPALGLTWRTSRTPATGTTPAPGARVLPSTVSQRVVTAPSGVVDGAVAYTTVLGIASAPIVGGASVTMSPTKNPRGLVASPDGTKFAYDRWLPGSQTVREIRSELTAGGSAVTVFSSTMQCDPRRWLQPTQLAVDCSDTVNSETVWGTVDTTTGLLTVSYRAPLTTTTGWHDSNPSWSPAGTTIAFNRTKADGSESRVMLVNADGSNVRSATTAPVTADTGDRNAAWTPAGDLVVVTSRFATLDPLFHEDLVLTRPATAPVLRLTSAASVSNVRLFEGLTVAPSGTRVLLHERTSILGDGGGRSRLILVGLSPVGLGGAAATVLVPSTLPASTLVTAWARAAD